MKRYFVVFGLLAVMCSLLSCSTTPSLDEEITLGPNAIKVPATQTWTKTDVSVQQGQFMHVEAQGKIEISKWRYFGRNYEYVVGPNGTYDFSTEVERLHWNYPVQPLQAFPLPAAVAGPAPCYALIGKIGEDGDIFLIGRDAVVEAKNSGDLYLGVNDFEIEDNRGDFYAKVDLYNQIPWELVKKDTRKIEKGTGRVGKPVEDPNVLIIYVDGLDYTVLTEMAYKGYLPNIKNLFFDNGINFPYTFSVFPSTTWTTTACVLSGNYSDLTGIKSDAYLDKRVNELRHFFTPFGPLTSSRRISPDIWDNIIDEDPRREKLPTIFSRMEDAKVPIWGSVLPVTPDQIPTFYDETLTKTVRILGTHQIKPKFDEINTEYTVNYVIKFKYDVMYTWLPGADVKSHETPRGQWGAARKQIYLIDKKIGELVDKLKLEGKYDRTYIILYSDHGHMGGKDFINQNFDITNDFFYKSIVDKDGDGELDDGSGLGFNVQWVWHDEALHREHVDKSAHDFMATGSMGYGAAVIYLPYKHKYSRNFRTTNSYYDLAHYQVHPTMKPVNVLNRLLGVDRSETNKFPDMTANKPIDMVIVPAARDNNTTLIINSQGLQGLIEMRNAGNGPRDFEYRYTIISDFDQDQEGNNSYTRLEALTAGGVAAEDPFHYTASPSFRKYIGENLNWFNQFHSGREWLRATKETEYPNAVVTFAHFTKWDESIDNLQGRFAPDFGVTPKRGWNFQSDERLATDHGYPLFDSVRVPFFITGPNIKKGVVNTTPHMNIDMVPTVLEIMGVEYDPKELDGMAVLDIYEEEVQEGPVFVRDERVAFYTDNGLPLYYPTPVAKTGYNLHNIDNPYDLHYLGSDVATSYHQQLLRLTDSILDVAIPGDSVRPFDTATSAIGRSWKEQNPDSLFVQRTSQFAEALRIKQFDVADLLSIIFQFYITANNIDRAQLLIDWIQDVGGDFNRLIGEPIHHGEKGLLPGQVINVPVDGIQFAVYKLKNLAQEVVMRTGYRAAFGIEHGIGRVHNTGLPKTWKTPEIVGQSDDSPFKMLDISE
ncbi:MAG: alkaline phosphatase family protein [Candidatus Brocadiales bacterium]